MYRLIVALFTVSTALSALPAFAASGEQRSAWSLDDILNQGSQLFTETITRGLAIIQDRFEMNATTTPSQNGEESTRLILKLFPKGKSQPDDALSLEGTFRRSADQHFGFDFHLVPPKHKAEPKEYI